MFITIISFVFLLSILVFVHEFGHFWMAKKFDLKPEEFGFGLPPRAFGVYRDKNGKWKKVKGNKSVKDADDTIYSVNWVPLGGFVKLGEDDEAGGNPNHFNSKPIWQRAMILLAGVSMNVVLAAILISFGFMVGLPQGIEGVSSHAKISNRQIQIVAVVKETPAKDADIRMGDMIVSVDTQKINVSEEFQNYIKEKDGQELSLIIRRGNVEIEKKIVPEIMEETGLPGIGIGMADIGLVKYPVHLAIWYGIKTTIIFILAILFAFYEMIKGLIMGAGVGADISGPVGIAVLTGQFARMGFVYFLQFTAILSMNLAIINALPFPALDGGRILFLIIEKFKGGPVKKEVEAMVHYIGFVLLMILVVFVTFKDIARYGDKFVSLWHAFLSLF
ncbi:RIP metalloprotease RseP [Candidatus Falkowbacteria bacterium RIFOXYB2_FULL_34_18]|uniref:Zinc metalloprotease n=1 Tax=Candidatus Falkowbacteria bacterium RIFOXYD2_FULL_34_120 TaxID=1798007 RepID=A0A1F5TMV4_9BACT|nr:MAG: RIP metalloprotease RseP [Candidatus Falkowbacteria bacterium RIFOXYB2_FULL_34_18]OGF28329.1 MAG: RIP metalloprotease RseP [Candidatus Falkowbacteria bacterium RIFOXYC12_FULL_34_55]OGF37952.1 MAG: RIP metalloprotease RseP [Candidatus Falkowbacteria bacterium RIFOXYC2_FULL_34_220]OGF39670.1 MAG: RIP metalloprotease RseP [Candidatus Falkowbacteria bacterium RIFOXYD12_FULL_34_57]OGF40109.1 MAG: RIP metalloprotease RseP [Candidatus Falkowbacteria bacterium RIFOXYD2_FULL_34_120]